MGLAIIILIRILFATCMVFIIGYVFGGFAKNPTLRIFTKIAAVAVVVLFILANIFLGFGRFRHAGRDGTWDCPFQSEQQHK